jgi:hypothetical protein
MDLARSTGWAFNEPSGRIAYGSFVLSQTRKDVGAYLNAADRAISGLADRFSVDMFAFASPILVVRRDDPLKLRKLYGLPNVIEQLADRRGIECKEDLEDRIRRHFLGRKYPRSRDRCKSATMVKCRERGWLPRNDDEGDALAGLDYFRSLYDPSFALAATPLFQDARAG